MKYVIVKQHGFEYSILSSEVLSHADISMKFECVSAGFCKLIRDSENLNEVKEVVVWGESFSLNLQSRPEDANIIKKDITFPRFSPEKTC